MAFRATQWSSSQKPSPCSKIRLARFIGRAWLRVRHNMLHIIWWISNFSKYDWERMRFPHAQPRERLSSARQSFLLITEMIFDYLIAIVSSKTAAIDMSEVTKKTCVRPWCVWLLFFPLFTVVFKIVLIIHMDIFMLLLVFLSL